MPPTETELKVETDKVQTSCEAIDAMFATNTGNDRDDHAELELRQQVFSGLASDIINYRNSGIKEQELIVEPRTKVRSDRVDIGNQIGDSALAALRTEDD